MPPVPPLLSLLLLDATRRATLFLAGQAAAPTAHGGVLPAAPTSIWPTTVMGWLAFVMALVALVGGFVAWGRLLEKLNGYGDRLKSVEGKHEEHSGILTTQTAALANVTSALERLHLDVGRAQRSAEGCTEDMREYALEIGAKLDAWRRELTADIGALRTDFHTMDKTLSRQLEGLQAEVRLTRAPTRREDA